MRLAKGEVGYSLDERLQAYLEMNGVVAERLSTAEHREWVEGWEAVYGHLMGGAGEACGKEAGGAFLREREREWVVVPFLSKGKRVGAYQCEGRLVDFGEIDLGEFFVSPIDLAWTFVVRGGEEGMCFLRG